MSISYKILIEKEIEEENKELYKPLLDKNSMEYKMVKEAFEKIGGEKGFIKAMNMLKIRRLKNLVKEVENKMNKELENKINNYEK